METRIGHCKYCHEQKIVEVPEDATQEMANQEATETCDCYGAKETREKEYQKQACIANVYEMLGEKYPEIAELFKGSIDALQTAKIKKITVNTYFNHSARLFKCKDGIKVELEKKQKMENLA